MSAIAVFPARLQVVREPFYRGREVGAVCHPHLEKAVTGVSGKRAPYPKGQSTQKKIMLSGWWGTRGVIHWELFLKGRTIDSFYYCDQLEETLNGKQDRVYYLRDNARPHTTIRTLKKI